VDCFKRWPVNSSEQGEREREEAVQDFLGKDKIVRVSIKVEKGRGERVSGYRNSGGGGFRAMRRIRGRKNILCLPF